MSSFQSVKGQRPNDRAEERTVDSDPQAESGGDYGEECGSTVMTRNWTEAFRSGRAVFSDGRHQSISESREEEC